MVSLLIEDVRDKIDPMHFGCLKGTSTSYCLLDMVHNRPFSKMAPTEGGLETGGIDCFAVCVPSP